jgi:branched-chain amino acid transport system permease protein
MQGELTADSFAAFTSIALLAIVFVAGAGRIAGAVVAGIMFSAAGLFVTFLNLHLNVGKYQAIVAGIALVLTAVQNPDGLTSTATGKGPAVALAKLRDRAAGEYHKRRPVRGTASDGTGGSGPNVGGDKHDAQHPVV